MSRPLPLDHLVYAATDLGETITRFERGLGVRATCGGRHEALGTHNAILPLGPARYIELIALDPMNPTPPLPPPFGLATLTEPRLASWAVRSVDLAADTLRAKREGYDPGLTLPVSRTTPDGAPLAWRLTLRPDGFGDGVIPFVIDWGDSPHPSGSADRGGASCHLQRFEASHPRPETIADALGALGVELDVQPAPTARLHATLRGPAGTLELR